MFFLIIIDILVRYYDAYLAPILWRLRPTNIQDTQSSIGYDEE